MDYQRVYDAFIADRLAKYSFKKKVLGRELHHILPICLGGSNWPENLISLVYSDHLFAHLLLSKIHGGTLTIAFILMLGAKRYENRRSRRLYNVTRKQFHEYVGTISQGKAASEERKARISAKLKGNKNALGKKNRLGTTQTAEWKAAQSLRMLGNKRAGKSRKTI